MKILLVNKFHYVKGGSETYYFGLGELLKQYGCKVVYFSMQDEKNRSCDYEKYFVNNVDFNMRTNIFQIAQMSLKMLYSFEARRKFEKLIRAEKPDIIHLNIFQSQLTGSIVDVAKKYNIPVVYTMHDLKSICPNYQMLNHGSVCEKCLGGKYSTCFKEGCMKESKLKSLLAALEAYVYKWNKTYKKIDLFITPSRFFSEKLRQANITNKPIIHMPNFLPKDTEYISNNKCGEYFLYFGRLSKEKGISTLIRAYQEAKIETPLYIVGTGPLEQEIQEMIEKYQVKNCVKMLGFKSGSELKEIIENAKCICLLSEWYENGPYSIMEAQAASRPVIVSGYGGLPELVEDGVTGYIIPAGNIEKVADILRQCDKKDDWNYELILEQARKKYSYDKYIERLMVEYEKLQVR